jgi:hypothetical protein
MQIYPPKRTQTHTLELCKTKHPPSLNKTPKQKNFSVKFLKYQGDTMSSWLIIVTGLIYAYIAAEQGFKGNMPMCICYACYAGANVGLYMMATK